MMNISFDSLGYGQLTSLSSAVTVASATIGGAVGIPAGTEQVVLQAETQNVRYRDDNASPTASVGMILQANVIYTFTVAQIAQMKVIEVTASAKLNITCYGRKT